MIPVRLFVSELELTALGAAGAVGSVSNEDGVEPPGGCDEDLDRNSWRASERAQRETDVGRVPLAITLNVLNTRQD